MSDGQDSDGNSISESSSRSVAKFKLDKNRFNKPQIDEDDRQKYKQMYENYEKNKTTVKDIFVKQKHNLQRTLSPKRYRAPSPAKSPQLDEQ